MKISKFQCGEAVLLSSLVLALIAVAVAFLQQLSANINNGDHDEIQAQEKQGKVTICEDCDITSPIPQDANGDLKGPLPIIRLGPETCPDGSDECLA